MADFSTIQPALILRPFRYRGQMSSETLSNLFEELGHDIFECINFINNKAIPILNGLGDGGTYSDISAITTGLDGRTILTHRIWADTTSPYYYNQTYSRPKSVYETFEQMRIDIGDLLDQVNSLTLRVGVAADDSTSTSTLSELETRINYVSNKVRTIENDTNQFLTAGEIQTAIQNGAINPSTFNIVDADVSTNAAILGTKVSGVDLTQSLAYGGGLPASYDMQDTVLRLKEFVEDTTGEAFSSYSSANTTGDSLKTHREKVGTGTPTSTNPHGLDIVDLSDSANKLNQPIQVASWYLKPAYSTGSAGGYHYIDNSYTVTKVAGVIGIGGSTGLNLSVYRRRSGVSVLIYSGLILPASSPGSAVAVAGFTNTDLQSGDLLFLSGISGDGTESRIFLYAQRA